MTRRENFESLELTVRHTELELFGSMSFRSNIVPMWLDLENFAIANSTCLQLAPVETKAQWDMLREVRRQIEIPFGVVESDKIDSIIADIRRTKDSATKTIAGIELMHMIRKGQMAESRQLTPAEQFYSLAG